jgi:RES domain-containing protein
LELGGKPAAGTMTTFWRISNHLDLGGWGGRKFASRWSSLGRRVVYLAESPAGAMMEVLVHLKEREGGLPRIYTLLKIEAPDDLSVTQLNAIAPTDWKVRLEFTRSLGDAWLTSMETPLARISSAIIPRTWNYLLNPEHPDAKKIEVAEVIRERFDNRLLRFGAR